MDRIAAAYGVSDARIAVMPNMVLAAGGHAAASLARGAATEDPIKRLDRTGAIADLAEAAEHAAIEPDHGLRRLDEIAVMPHRFGVAGVILGHMVLTIGLALILQPTPEALGMAALFGRAGRGAEALRPPHPDDRRPAAGGHGDAGQRAGIWLAPDYLGQRVGGELVSDELGGFFGGLLVTPVAAWVATRTSGPPSLATFLPAFWLLVPGAVSLIGIAEFVGPDREAGLDHFVHAIDVFISISLGVLVGNALVLRFSRRA